MNFRILLKMGFAVTEVGGALENYNNQANLENILYWKIQILIVIDIVNSITLLWL